MSYVQKQMKMKQINTLHGLDESILDRISDDPPKYTEEVAFQDWLTRHGYSSKEEYYREQEAEAQEEW